MVFTESPFGMAKDHFHVPAAEFSAACAAWKKSVVTNVKRRMDAEALMLKLGLGGGYHWRRRQEAFYAGNDIKRDEAPFNRSPAPPALCNEWWAFSGW